MPSKAEKHHRRQIAVELRQHEQVAAAARMPISKADLKSLFEGLDRTLFERRGEQTWCRCDHTLRHTREFLRARSLPEDAIVAWLGEYGGHCDCEVAANVTNEWAGLVGY